MSRDRTKLHFVGAAVLGLVMLSGCSERPSPGANARNGASKPPSEAPPTVRAPADSPKSANESGASKLPAKAPPTVQPTADITKSGSDKKNPPTSPSSESRPVAELIEAAKEMKDGAIDALAAAGPKAIPEIIAELRRDDRRYSWATAAMGKMGPAAIEQVLPQLNDSDYFMRKIAYMTLGEMGPLAMPALPALQRAAQQDRDPRNRGLAASAISQISRR